MGGICLLFILLTTTPAWSQTNAPALSVSLISSNQVMLTITNGNSSTVYEVYYTEFLDANPTWKPLSTGQLGQTNFFAWADEDETRFYRAVIGSDWDLDGVPNSQDARPTDPNIGLLTVTIESPANNSLVY